MKVRRELPSALADVRSRLSNQDHAFQRNNLSRHTTQRQELNSNRFLNGSKARISAPHNRALHAKFYDAIFSPEARVAWLIRDEGTVAAVLGNDQFDARILAGHKVGKRRYRDEGIVL